MSFKTIQQQFRPILHLAFPGALSQLIQLLNGIIATIFVARLGADDLAAYALGWMCFVTIMLFNLGILFSISVMMGRAFGAKDPKKMQDYNTAGLHVALLICMPMIIILFLAKDGFLLFGQSPQVAHLAGDYCRVAAIGVVPMYFSVAIRQTLLGMGRPRILNYYSVLQVIINTLLNYAFVLGKWGAPKLGVIGVGVSIAISGWLLFIFVWGYFLLEPHVKKYNLSLNITNIQINHIKTLFKIGMPIGGSMGIEITAMFILSIVIGSLSVHALAAYQVVEQLDLLAIMIPWGASQAISTVISQLIGAEKYHLIKPSTWAAIILVSSPTLLFAIAYLVFPSFFIHIFLQKGVTPNVYYFAKHMLFITALFVIFDALRITTNGTLRGMKDVNMPLMITVISFWIIGIPVALLLGYGFKLGALGIWWGFGICIFTVFLGIHARLLQRFSQINILQ